MIMDIMDKIINQRVHFLLQTIIIWMAVNNLQGVMIFILHTQEVFRWQNLCGRRFGDSEISAIVGLSTSSKTHGRSRFKVKEASFQWVVKHWEYSYDFDWSYEHGQTLGEVDV